MIRMTIQIVPFGIESSTRTLEEILISNITPGHDHPAKYIVQHGAVRLEIEHDRRDGVLTLAHKAIAELLHHNPPQPVVRLNTPHQIATESLDEAFTGVVDRSVHSKEDAPHALPRGKLFRLFGRSSRSRTPPEGTTS